MTQSVFLTLVQETIFLMLLLSAPILIVSLVVGVVIGILQAVTQVQEATVSFVPKILASMIVLVLASPWMLNIYVSRTQQILSNLVSIARQH